MNAAVNRFDLTGKVALVTGGSRGLGREVVRGLSQAGADVVITSRNLESCETLAQEVRSTTGRNAFAFPCHVGRWNDLQTLVDAAYGHFGRIDILVNNAGMSPAYDHVLNITEDLYDKVLGVNLKGPFRLTAIIGTRMAEGGGGSIINISSGASVRPQVNMIAYSAAKAGLNALTIAYAHIFGPKVRVNSILAGAFKTDLMANAWTEERLARNRKLALQRPGEPAEIVGTAVYLASDASSYTTGALLAVDGGLPL